MGLNEETIKKYIREQEVADQMLDNVKKRTIPLSDSPEINAEDKYHAL